MSELDAVKRVIAPKYRSALTLIAAIAAVITLIVVGYASLQTVAYASVDQRAAAVVAPHAAKLEAVDVRVTALVDALEQDRKADAENMRETRDSITTIEKNVALVQRDISYITDRLREDSRRRPAAASSSGE